MTVMPNTLEREIHKATGVLIKGIPPDGKSRAFRVGSKEWYAISLGNCGSFGCFASGALFGWSSEFNSGKAWPIHLSSTKERLSRQQLRVEKELVKFGNSMQDAGRELCDGDSDRYILALKRVIESNGER